MSSAIEKLVDLIIIDAQADVLRSSNLQFGFKQGTSTTQCTFVATEVINYYLNNKSNVYSLFLDASKAFDRVNYVKIFSLLITFLTTIKEW